MLRGFKDFILRGNVVELAVAVVVGTAFTAIVTAISDNLINPVIAALGSPGDAGLTTVLRDDVAGAVINWDAVITAAINFLIVASVVYFLFVLPMNKLNERRARGQEPEPEPVDENVILLQEIRDLLQAQRPGPSGPGAHQRPIE